MQTIEYTLGPGCAPNPGFEATYAFLKAAETEFLRQHEKPGFLETQDWFVVHHLSVIATELFLKSFHYTVSHGPVTTPDGPDDETFKHAFGGHVAGLEELPKEVPVGLKKYLPEHLYELMNSLSGIEIAPGAIPIRGV